jgi:KDO II ethanolaminephosphotransferase
MTTRRLAITRPALVAGGTAYLGLALNAPALLALHATSPLQTLALAVLVCAATYLLLHLVALAGATALQLFLTVAIPTSVAAAYFTTAFGIVLDYGMVAAVFGSEATLARELAGPEPLAWIAVFGLAPVVLLWRHTRVVPAPRGARSSLRFHLAAPAAALAAWGAWLGVEALSDAYETTHLVNVAVPSVVVAQTFVPLNWLAGTAVYVADRVGGARKASTLLDPTAHHRYDVPARAADTVLVFVLGESARHDRMSLYGYPRATTPLLAAEPDVAALHGRACDTITKSALACMFVRPGGVVEDPVRHVPIVTERNVFWVLTHLGFTMDVFATQGEVAFYLATGAGRYKYRETYAALVRDLRMPVDDAALLPDLAESLARHPRGGHVILLHTMGSHWLYPARYPAHYARFGPSCASAWQRCSEEQWRNAYDNTLVYTDYLLWRVIEALRDRKALLVYTSDHGESLGEGGFLLHGTPKARAPIEQRAVPLIVWASRAWIADPANAAAFARLRARKDEVFGHETLFDSLLDCLGITSPDGGVERTRSWCGEGASLHRPAVSSLRGAGPTASAARATELTRPGGERRSPIAPGARRAARAGA